MPLWDCDAALQIALDEVLLNRGPGGSRTWVPDAPAVVLGVSSRACDEIDRQACEADGLRILRRMSGGAAVLLSPGVACFSAFLPYEAFAEAASIGGAYRLAARAVAEALARLGIPTTFEPPCDLACRGRKLVGIAQARRRSSALVHGTVPVVLDIESMGRYLEPPPQEPAYRAGRPHVDFMTAAGREVAACGTADVVRELARAFDAARLPRLDAGPDSLADAQDLAATKYRTDAWTFRR